MSGRRVRTDARTQKANPRHLRRLRAAGPRGGQNGHDQHKAEISGRRYQESSSTSLYNRGACAPFAQRSASAARARGRSPPERVRCMRRLGIAGDRILTLHETKGEGACMQVLEFDVAGKRTEQRTAGAQQNWNDSDCEVCN